MSICKICKKDLKNESNPFSEKICDKCLQRTSNNIDINYLDYLNSPHYKPNKFIFHKQSHERINNLYCGIELEIQGSYPNQFLHENCNNPFIYYKKDCSLNSMGIEIVSHPATLKYHLNHWKNIFISLNKNKLVDTDNCGLHFHFNKDYFSKRQIASIDYFINNSKAIIEAIGGRRTDYNYFEIIHKKFDSYGKTKEQYIDPFGNIRFKNFGKYLACNLNNKETIELRFCKSTYNYEVFLKRLKYVFYIIEFCIKFDTMAFAYTDSIQTFFERFIENKTI